MLIRLGEGDRTFLRLDILMSSFSLEVVGEVWREGWGESSSVSCCRDDGKKELDFGIIGVALDRAV